MMMIGDEEMMETNWTKKNRKYNLKNTLKKGKNPIFFHVKKKILFSLT